MGGATSYSIAKSINVTVPPHRGDFCGFSILVDDSIGKLGGVQRTQRVLNLRKKIKSSKNIKNIGAKCFAQS